VSEMATAQHVRLTERMVAANPFQVILERKVRQSTGTGGFRMVSPEVPINPFPARRIGHSGDLVEMLNEDGQMVLPSWTFIAHPDNDVQVGDTFLFCGNKCEVLKVDRNPPWRVSAVVHEYG
jgi:hypothetical protein